MLTEVEVLSNRGSLLTLPLADVTDGIVLVDVEGLNPVKATLVTSKMAGMNGSQFLNSTGEERNLKFKFLMEPNIVGQTVEDVRNKLYEFFMPQAEVSFTFRKDNGVEVGISGRVETFEGPYFTADPEANISVLCFDTDFVVPEAVLVPGYSVNDGTTFEIEYPGSAATGINFHLLPDRDLTEFTIYSTMPNGENRNLDFAAPMLAFDSLVIETQKGNKSVTQYRDNQIFAQPLYGVSPQSAWTELRPGTNIFRIFAEGDPIQFLLSYYIRYGGL